MKNNEKMMCRQLESDIVRPVTLSNRELECYHELGYLLLREFVVPSLAGALREEIFEVLEHAGASREQLSQAEETADKLRQSPLYLQGSLLDKLINSENTLSVASTLIGGRAVRYFPFTAVKAGGGGGAFHFHQDNNYTPHDPPLGSINIWLALVDMSPENGCLQIVPGSHKLGALPWVDAGDGDQHRKLAAAADGALPIRMRAGDAVAFTRLTVHGSGPNLTNRPRMAYALQYHREDVKFQDSETGEWRLLADSPRWQTAPLPRLEKRHNSKGD